MARRNASRKRRIPAEPPAQHETLAPDVEDVAAAEVDGEVSPEAEPPEPPSNKHIAEGDNMKPEWEPSNEEEFRDWKAEYDAICAAEAAANAPDAGEDGRVKVGEVAAFSEKGFWRCKRFWSRQPTTIYEGEFTPEQIEILRHEPNLKMF